MDTGARRGVVGCMQLMTITHHDVFPTSEVMTAEMRCGGCQREELRTKGGVALEEGDEVLTKAGLKQPGLHEPISKDDENVELSCSCRARMIGTSK
jgi:hypothetical protein